MPKTILIAASDPNIIYLLQRYAETSGFHVTNAGQGIELQQMALHTAPDLIVLEVGLPSDPAEQALRRLKTDPTTCDIPVVVYSCYDEFNGLNMEGAASYLQKSVMYSDFVEAVEQAGVVPK